MVHFQYCLHSLIASPAIHLKCESVDKAKNESEKVVKKSSNRGQKKMEEICTNLDHRLGGVGEEVSARRQLQPEFFINSQETSL